MNKIWIIGVAGLMLAGCGVDTSAARRALEAQGLTQIKIGGYSWYGCGQEDNFRSEFTAIGTNGKPVRGVVCSGLWKGITVRYY